MKAIYIICKNNYYSSTLGITLLPLNVMKIIIKPGTHAYGNLSSTDPMSGILFLAVDMKKIIFIFRVLPHSPQQQFWMCTPVSNKVFWSI